MEFENRPGIYSCTYIKTGKRYIGSSSNTKKRLREHLWALRSGLHKSPYLQNAWNKYGENAFKWDVEEFCEVKDLLLREQYYIDQGFVFNVMMVAGNRQGVRHSDEAKAKMSATKKRPEYAIPTSNRAKELWKNPVFTEKLISAIKMRLSDPVICAAHVAVMNTPEATANRLSTQKSQKYRENMSKLKKGQTHTPETIEKMRLSHIARHKKNKIALGGV